MVGNSPLLKSLSSRFHEEDVSVRTRLLEIAARMSGVISLGRGDPDFHSPPHVVEAAIRALRENQHHYTHPAGMLSLREAIASKLNRENDLSYDSDEVLVTAGVQEAILLSLLALVDVGDEVLLSAPRYTTYDHAIVLAGGIPTDILTYEADNFALMPEQIERRLSGRSKVLVLVTPNNPTGAVTPPDIIRQIAQLAQEHNLLVISDEIYEKLIYDNNEHLSIGTLPGMRERTITVNGFSKAYAMTGWRVGYLAAPRELTRKLIELRHASSICTTTPSQYAALAAITGPQEVVEEMRRVYDDRRRLIMTSLDAMGLSYGHPGGAYYVYVNVSSTGMSASAFCETMLREAHVLMFPGSLFADPTEDHIRISLVQPKDQIEEALQRMTQVLRGEKLQPKL